MAKYKNLIVWQKANEAKLITKSLNSKIVFSKNIKRL